MNIFYGYIEGQSQQKKGCNFIKWGV